MERDERTELNRDLARLADGDRSAFHAVFTRLVPELRQFASRHLSGEDAEDAAQQALVSLFARASEYDPERDALAWALGIVAWEVRTIRKRVQRRRESTDPDAAHTRAADGGSPEDEAIARDLDSCVRAALGTLSADDADALLAFPGAGPRPGVAPATFRKRVQRALSRFREAWRSQHDDE